MSCSVDHFLKAENLRQMLIDGNLVSQEDDRWILNMKTSGQELGERPVSFVCDDEITWEAKWSHDPEPAVFISSRFPRVTFTYEVFYEGEHDGIYSVSDGVFTEA